MNKYTSKVIYSAGNACGNQYATKNCHPYGTKWRIRYNKETGRIVGTPTLLDSNWPVDVRKVEASDDFYCNL